jgi:hypothetical protein
MSGKHAGRPANERRLEVMQKYGVSTFWSRRLLTDSLLDQLERCPSEEARKILLGIVEPCDSPVPPSSLILGSAEAGR